MATNSVLAKLAVNISANTAQFNQALNKTHNKLNAFTTGLQNLAGTIGVAFSVQQVASFALEVSKLSGEAEGVRRAFERLPNNVQLMNDLKRATGGTVSELDLMKRAVQASNFDISLSALPRLLEFATLRAQQTGQSVDYLVDSIVTGIGRKSKLILDNLGISAVQLTDALGGASAAASSIGDVADAVGRIAEENLQNMAGFSENAATKIQRLEASWINLKVAIGDTANSTGVLGSAIDAVTSAIDMLASKDVSFLEKYARVTGALLTGNFLLLMNDAKPNLPSGPMGPAAPKSVFDLDSGASILGVKPQKFDPIKTGLTEVIKLSETAKKALTGESMHGTSSRAMETKILGFDADATAEAMLNLRNTSAETTEAIAENWVDLSGIVGGAISNMAEGLGAAIVGVEDFGTAVIHAFADFAKQFGQMLIASGVAALALRTVLVNPVAAIAAGAALVAIGGAASAALSRATGGHSGGGAPGRTPSEVKVDVGGRISGYDIALNQVKEGYRRGRMG